MSPRRISICICCPRGGRGASPIRLAELARLIDVLAAARVDLVVMEASGGYERPCADLLAEAGLAVAVVNPRQVRRFAGALGKLAKTDAVDAALIAEYGVRMRPSARHRCDPEPQSPDGAGRQASPIGRHDGGRTPARRPGSPRFRDRRGYRATPALPRTGSGRYRTTHRHPHCRPSALVAPLERAAGDQGRRSANRNRADYPDARARHGRSTTRSQHSPVSRRSTATPAPAAAGASSRAAAHQSRRRLLSRRTLRRPLQSRPESLLPAPARQRQTTKNSLVAVARKLLTILNAIAKQTLKPLDPNTIAVEGRPSSGTCSS